MATFEYQALDVNGKSHRGIIEADNPRDARQTLRSQSLTPININNSSASNPKNSIGTHNYLKFSVATHKQSLGGKELVLITRQIATLIETAVPLEEALNAVAQQSDREKTRRLILSIRERVLEGWRLADALAEHEKSFSSLYRAVVSAGETSGDLGAVLSRLANMLEKNRAIQSKALTALIYPSILATVSLGVVIALMRFVVPEIVEQFKDFDTELPVVTQFVISISNAITNYGVSAIGVFLVISLAGWWALKSPVLKLRFDRYLLNLPLIGKLLRGLEAARFGRTLATLFAGGAPLIDALLGAQRTISNQFIKARLDDTITMVREGAGLSTGLRKANVLPPMMTHMVAAGEKSGELPKLLDKTADHLENEFETVTTVGLRVLEPIIVVAMGLIVMVIVLSIMLPTLQLNSLASGG